MTQNPEPIVRPPPPADEPSGLVPVRGEIEWRPELMEAPRTFVPPTLRATIVRYVEQGIYPGSGMLQILENRPLSEIVGSVDDEVERHLGNIYRFLHIGLGSLAWGDPERVRGWMRRKGIDG